MIAALAFLPLLAQAPQTIDVIPSADAWVYGHASTPGLVERLRVWGTGSDAIEKDVPPAGDCSYAFFNFPIDTAGLEKAKVTEAKVIVYFEKNDDLTADVIKSSPLEARALDLIFTDKDFAVDSMKIGPDAAVFGKGTIAEAEGEDKYKMTIDLLGKDSAFGEWFQRAIEKKQIGIALTSTIFPGDAKGALYRIISKEGSKTLQARLVVKYQAQSR